MEHAGRKKQCDNNNIDESLDKQMRPMYFWIFSLCPCGAEEDKLTYAKTHTNTHIRAATYKRTEQHPFRLELSKDRSRCLRSVCRCVTNERTNAQRCDLKLNMFPRGLMPSKDHRQLEGREWKLLEFGNLNA